MIENFVDGKVKESLESAESQDKVRVNGKLDANLVRRTTCVLRFVH
jgi:hypothetical protein